MQMKKKQNKNGMNIKEKIIYKRCNYANNK